MFRVVVQDSRLTPTSGRVVAQLGHYDPHAKVVVIDKEQAATFLSNGAQPSDRVARLLQKEGVKLPEWVKIASDKERTIRNSDKLRRNRPAEEKAEEPAEEVAAEDTPATEEPATEEPAVDEAPVAEEKTEEPAEEPKAEAEAEDDSDNKEEK